VPSWNCDEAKILVLLSFLLVLRTWLSIWLASVNGRIVKTIVGLDFNMFLKRIAELLIFAIPASTINSGLDYFNKILALMFRRRLTKHFHEQYLRNMHYYKICNLDSRIANPDQRLTADTEKWGQSLANLYLNITKPVLDVFLFSRNLAQLVGWQGPSMIFSWYFFSGFIIKSISPPFGRLTAIEQKFEGDYRFLHNEVLAHSEEIAFYKGHEWEKKNVVRGWDRLKAHTESVLAKRFIMGIFDSMLVKYGAVTVGYAIVGLPVFGPGSKEYLASMGNDTAALMSDYIRNSSMLVNLSKAVGRLVVSYKEV
jgi:ATP-binding cassette subfamily D (ALD) protein 3